MTYICYNNSFLTDTDSVLTIDSRAFRYGDGVFETIIFNGTILRFWQDHFLRLTDGLQKLKIEIPANFELELKQNIFNLIIQNQHSNFARIRLQVWRKDGGIYTPTSNECNYFIQSFDYKVQNLESLEIAVCENMGLSYSPVSHLKTCNAIPYIIASLEKQERGLGDLILLDTNGNISEGTSSNVFWIENEQWFTPSLRTGCIAGVMRKNIIKSLEKIKKPAREVEVSIEKLHIAQGIFLSNVTGIKGVSRFEDINFDISFIEKKRSYLESVVETDF